MYTTEAAKINSVDEKCGSTHRVYKSYAKCKDSSAQSDTSMHHTQNQHMCMKDAVVLVVQHNSRIRLKHDTLQKYNTKIHNAYMHAIT